MSQVSSGDRVGESTRSIRIVDCDVHFKPRDYAEYLEYFPETLRSRKALPRTLRKGPVLVQYAGSMRFDAKPPDGPAGSDPITLGRQLFLEAGVDIAINVPIGDPFATMIDPELDAAVSSATNEWQAATWLSAYNHHGRNRGSIQLPVNNIDAAVREIDKWAGHPFFVQASVPHTGGVPYGHPRFDVLWAAAARHRLPVAIHATVGGPDLFGTPVGYLQRFPEMNSIMYPLGYAAHLVSFLSEGTFVKFPDFRVVFVEGGFSWFPPVVSRLDRNWEKLAGDSAIPTALPSSYLRDHVRFTSQPVEEPEDPKQLADMYEWGDAEHLLMFSSDYPHWDYDHPSRALPATLGAGLRRRIHRNNALDFYGLADTRFVDEYDAQPQAAMAT